MRRRSGSSRWRWVIEMVNHRREIWVALAIVGVPTLMVFAGVCTVGALVGAVNGSLVAYLRMPSIVVTLAMMIVLRDALRWITQGAWVQDLPPDFQWMGLSQATYPFAAGALAVAIAAVLAWGLR